MPAGSKERLELLAELFTAKKSKNERNTGLSRLCGPLFGVFAFVSLLFAATCARGRGGRGGARKWGHDRAPRTLAEKSGKEKSPFGSMWRRRVMFLYFFPASKRELQFRRPTSGVV